MPNRDVAPKYTSVAIETRDGRSFSGLPLAGPGDDGQERLTQPDGTNIAIPLDAIERRSALATSIMPADLAELLSVEELHDLIAYLLSDERPGSTGG